MGYMLLIIAGVLIILFLIIGVTSGLFDYWSLLREENKKRRQLKTIEYKDFPERIKGIEYSAMQDNIKVVVDKVFRFSSNQPTLKWEVVDGVLKLTSENENELPDNALTVFYLPIETQYGHLKFNLKTGNITADQVYVNNIDFKTEKGNIDFTNLNVENATKVEAGTGNVTFTDGKYNDMDVLVDVGSLSTSCVLNGNCKCIVNRGSISLKTLRKLSFYKIHLEAESGFVGLDGRRGTRFIINGGPHSIDCVIRIGNASLSYVEQKGVSFGE